MLVSTLISDTRDVLQDADADYWSDAELLEYYNSGIRAIASERIEEPTTTDVALTTGTNLYTVSGVLRYISAEDDNNIERKLYPDDESGEDDTYGVIIQDYDRIYVNNPVTGVTITIKIISLPTDAITTDTVRFGDEDTLRYFMLSRAYEKEQDTENFQKSQYFMVQYRMKLNQLLKHSKSGYRDRMELTTGYFY